jgi:hypothetical protein
VGTRPVKIALGSGGRVEDFTWMLGLLVDATMIAYKLVEEGSNKKQ